MRFALLWATLVAYPVFGACDGADLKPRGTGESALWDFCQPLPVHDECSQVPAFHAAEDRVRERCMRDLLRERGRPNPALDQAFERAMSAECDRYERECGPRKNTPTSYSPPSGQRCRWSLLDYRLRVVKWSAEHRLTADLAFPTEPLAPAFAEFAKLQCEVPDDAWDSPEEKGRCRNGLPSRIAKAPPPLVPDQPQCLYAEFRSPEPVATAAATQRMLGKPGPTVETKGTYQGTVGNLAVALALETPKENRVRGSYFYVRRNLSIELDGWRNGDQLSLDERSNETTTGRFVGKIVVGPKEAVFEGRWFAAREADFVDKLPFRLVRVADDPRALDTLRPKDEIRISKKAPTLRFQDAEYQMVPHPRNAAAALPQFLRIGGTPANVLEKVNRRLADLLSGQICDGSSDGYETTAKVTYAQNAVLSVEIHASYFCGGAYPTNDANESMVFDLKTGDPVTFTDLFGGSEEDEARTKLYRKLYAGHLAARAEDEKEGFWTLDTLASYGSSYHVVPEGLVLQPRFPHVIEALSKPVLVPFRTAKPLAVRGSILERLP